MSVTINGFTQTTTSPFVLFPLSSSGNNKTYFNGLNTNVSTGNYYYNETSGNTELYVFQRVGDHSSATGSITIPINSSVKAYLVGGGGNGGDSYGGGGGGGGQYGSFGTGGSGLLVLVIKSS